MEEKNEITGIKQQVKTLETEVKKFANQLPYWAKYLSEKLLSGKVISGKDIDDSYSYLLEDLKINPETEKEEIVINNNSGNYTNYKPDLLFSKLENIEGVNALSENQTIEFSPNLTIIYGANGSGKSGYVRLFKKSFYSKAPEEILPNVYVENNHKPIYAKFSFISSGSEISLEYPLTGNSSEFEQFSVFDGKSVLSHLEQKNEFEFRPSGLNFFADLTAAIIRVEQKLNSEITTRQSENEFSLWFVGESEIKTFIENLSALTKIEELNKYTPFSEDDRNEQGKFQKQYDELLLISKGKEKEIKNLENINKLLNENRKSIEFLNQYFDSEYLGIIKNAITNCINKEAIAKAEGIENFKTDRIEGIGTDEWKNFIVAAEAFAKNQKPDKTDYPKKDDNCLLCHQPLSEDAAKLISNYWLFIKSVAEENAKTAQTTLRKAKQNFESLNFDLFPEENTLTVWLTNKYPKLLEELVKKLSELKELSENIVSDITNKTAKIRDEIKISVLDHATIEEANHTLIRKLKEDEQFKELEKLLKTKIYLDHKEKYNTHFSKFEIYVNNQVWLNKASKANYSKRKVTDAEKAISEKYFSQKYLDIFNIECEKLNGNFEIKILHTGTAGKSYRQLRLKGRSPNAVLSEGEQKVLAIADFLSEIQLSEINRGIIFDDPVNSLDDKRKKDIADRLSKESENRQVVIFTHDLIFVSNLITYCEENKIFFFCHWMENRDNNPGQVWLNNAPSYEKEYRNAEPAKKRLIEAKGKDCSPEKREFHIKSGFTALRTCYEVLVINDLFKNVVQRYNERVSVDALSSVCFDDILVNELLDSFAQCCRYMEGHTHSDKFAYKKPEPENLNEEIQRFETIRSKIKKAKKISV